MAGGGVDFYPHETILHAAVREVKKKTNIKIKSIDAFVGQYMFQARWMLWARRNLKIMFIGSVEGGNEGLQDIKLSLIEHQDYCWVAEARVKKMKATNDQCVLLSPIAELETTPKDIKWEHMRFISPEAKKLALKAFDEIKSGRTVRPETGATACTLLLFL